MPREITHWIALDGMHKALLTASPEISALIDKNISAARLGAVAHDAPYYLALSNPTFEMISELLHGTEGQDTLKPLSQLAAEIGCSPIPDKLWAFLFGMVSHYAVDTTFHPLIYYFTGNYYHKERKLRLEARRRHRAFEVFLDSFLNKNSEGKFNLKISSLITDLSSDLALICSWLGSTLQASEPEPDQAWRGSFDAISSYQAIFSNDLYGMGAKLINLLSFRSVAQYEALFSFGRRRAPKFFSASMQFRNPVSGKEETQSVSELLERSISIGANLIRQIYREPHSLALGLSLNFGIANTTPQMAKYYFEDKLDFLG